MSSYSERLIKEVIDNSQSKIWSFAVLEWFIADREEDEEALSTCVCGKTGLRYLFTIQNSKTGNTLFPIGSECIKKFERDDLYETAKTTESLFKLLHAIRAKTFIKLNSEFFTRSLIIYLYQNDAFKAENDYEFFLRMFNMRDKDKITYSQQKYINGIIGYSILPWLEENYGTKIRKKTD